MKRTVYPTRASALTAMAIAVLGCSAAPVEPRPKTGAETVVTPAPPASATASAPADATAEERMIAELRHTSDPRRGEILDELAARFGGAALVRALDTVVPEPPEKQFLETQDIFRRLHDLADPRAADPLVQWLQNGELWLHWVGEAAQRLAEVGDLRAAPYLAKRMHGEPGKVYDEASFWQADAGGHLTRTDLPRVVAARLLADLAILYPDKQGDLESIASKDVLAWLEDRPQPHANGLRFLAATGSARVLPKMREWAFPKTPLPALKAQPPFPADYETAQMALRYIGSMKDAPSFSRIASQLKRKTDRKLDISQDGLSEGGHAMLGMALRAVGYGAAQGLEEWGDSRATQPLVDLIEDEKWHEEARLAACEALAYCSNDPSLLVTKTKEFMAKTGPAKVVIASCYAAGLVHRPSMKLAADLVDLLDPTTRLESVRTSASRALATLPLDGAIETKLAAKLGVKEIRARVMVALLLGGSRPVSGLLTIAHGFGEAEIELIKDEVTQTFEATSTDDPAEALVGRWAMRAQEAAGVSIDGAPETWLRKRLASAFENLVYDIGPHTRSRVVLRARLFRMAQGSDAAARQRAIAALAIMKEKGTLAALATAPGETGELAKKALTVNDLSASPATP